MPAGAVRWSGALELELLADALEEREAIRWAQGRGGDMSERRKMAEAAARGATKGVAAKIREAMEATGLSVEEVEHAMREDLQRQLDQIERLRACGVPMDPVDVAKALGLDNEDGEA